MADIADESKNITLLTDFGTQDGFVGVMKGVIAGIAPGTSVIDLSHEVPPQNIRAAAFLLETSYRFFPPGSVHVVVVDPGVGSERRGLVAESREQFFIGPDNGVLTPILDNAEVRAINNPRLRLSEVSPTFHGRDVFAPAAAFLIRGTPIHEFGPRINDPVALNLPQPRETAEGIEGRIVYIDRFGNLITNFTSSLVQSLRGREALAVLEDGSQWPVRKTYSAAGPGQPCAVVGGFDRLELSIFMGSAETKSGAQVGSRVWLQKG